MLVPVLGLLYQLDFALEVVTRSISMVSSYPA